ncbi:MAG TPA: DUF3450 family protein [Xanthomonadales bacterium]|nr:DUF3450 family protein [Xanthomonadales bacterium]
MTLVRILTCFVAVLTGLTGTLHAQEASEALAKRLVTMRGQVDDLQNELNLKREEHKNRMVYLTAQQTEIEASRDREALRVRQLEEALQATKEEVAAAGASSETLAPMILDYLATLRSQVQKGFPFKTGERLAELDEIQAQLDSGVITAQRAFNRLWAFIEDELRISRENSIYTQSIQLQGENMLVDVAKLGNAMLYFRTRDLKYGRAVETDAGWRFELLESASDQELVARLFDSLRKQIRQGYFQLPNALPLAQEASS